MAGKYDPTDLLRSSPITESLVEYVEKIALLDAPVLITGESGVGKTTLGHSIHELSAVPDANLKVLNCAALSPEQLEEQLATCLGEAFVEKSTLLIDGIEEMPLEYQAKLMQLFEPEGTLPNKRKCVARVIATTQCDLSERCNKGKFRSDIYYRLNVLDLTLPPLRSRAAAIPRFALRLLREQVQGTSRNGLRFSSAAIMKLQQHSWPGNIKELQNVIERAFVASDGDEIDESDLSLGRSSDKIQSEDSNGTLVTSGIPLMEIERIAIINTLKECNGNKSASARMLGISERSIYNKIKRLGIDIK